MRSMDRKDDTRGKYWKKKVIVIQGQLDSTYIHTYVPFSFDPPVEHTSQLFDLSIAVFFHSAFSFLFRVLA